jgi:hypothetical protein
MLTRRAGKDEIPDPCPIEWDLGTLGPCRAGPISTCEHTHPFSLLTCHTNTMHSNACHRYQGPFVWPVARRRAGVDIKLNWWLDPFNAAQGSCLAILNGPYAVLGIHKRYLFCLDACGSTKVPLMTRSRASSRPSAPQQAARRRLCGHIYKHIGNNIPPPLLWDKGA